MLGDRVGPKVALNILRGKAASRSREMKGPTLLIGSGAHCDIQMRSVEVAAKHCLLSRVGGRVTVQALDPRFAVHVNGSRIGETELAHGDKLAIGPFELSVTIEAIPEDAPELEAPDRSTLARALLRQAETPLVPPEPVAAGHRDDPSPRVASAEPAPTPLGQLLADREAVEARLKELEAERERFSRESSELRHSIQEHAKKEVALVDRLAELDRREQSIQASEDAAQRQRLVATDELLRLEREKESIGRKRGQLKRLRDRLSRRFKAERAHWARIEDAVNERLAQADRRQSEAEALIDHNRVVAEELGRRAVEIDQSVASLAARARKAEERQAELEERGAELSRREENLRIKEHALERFRDDLEQRKLRLAEEEEAVRRDRGESARDLEHSRQRSDEIRTIFEGIEGKRRALESQESALRELASKVEQARLAQAEDSRQLAIRQAEIDHLESTARAREAALDQRESELNVRERAAMEARQRAERDLQRATAAEAALIEQRRVLEERERRQQEQTKQWLAAIEAERGQLAGSKVSAIEQTERLERERLALDEERARWIGRSAECQESAVELAERESILRARQTRLEQLERDRTLERERLEQERQSLEMARGSLDERQRGLTDTLERSREQAEQLESKSRDLETLAGQLDTRQRELLDRERAWCDEIQRRRGEIESLQSDIDAKRDLLDRQAKAQRRQVERIREVGWKFLRRKSEAPIAQESRPAGAPKPLLEAVSRYADEAALRSREAIEWMEKLRRENRELTQLQSEVAAQSRAILSACRSLAAGSFGPEALAAGAAATKSLLIDQRRALLSEMEQALGGWQGLLDRLHGTLADREADLERREREQLANRKQLERLLMIARGDENQTSVDLPLAAAGEAALADLAAPLKQPTRPTGVISLETLRERLTESGLLTDIEVESHARGAGKRGRSLEEELIATRQLTRYQLSCIRDNRLEDLRIGPALVEDVLHVGRVATTYRARLESFDAPVALRVIHPRWTKDEIRKNGVEFAARAVADIKHPHVARLLQPARLGESLGLAFELIDGASLAELAPYSPPPAAIARLTLEVVSALAAIERAGYTHRGIRPTRIMVGRDGHARLLGLGEPEWLIKGSRCEAGKEMATYIAPEEATSSGAVDIRGDLYSVARIMLDWALASAAARVTGPTPGLEGFPNDFEATLRRWTAEEPSERAASAAAALATLEKAFARLDLSQDPWPEFPTLLDALRGESVVTLAA